MSKFKIGVLILLALCFAMPAFAVDGVVLINQATVTAAGGFPYTITQQGSYKLSGNLTVSGATDGIDINTDNVSIDLNGFTISGPVVCSESGPASSITCTWSSANGIKSSSNNIAVRNGVIRGFGFGMSLLGNNNTVEEMAVSGNAQTGIVVYNGVVRRNTASHNGYLGIIAWDSTVTENVANHNFAGGIGAYHSTVIQNTAVANGGSGLYADDAVLYGSNTFFGNSSGAVYGGSGSSVSQGNNLCGPSTSC